MPVVAVGRHAQHGLTDGLKHSRRERAAGLPAVAPSSGQNEFVSRMRDAIADDLDAPRVVEVVDEWVASQPSEGDSAVAQLVDALLGVNLTER